MERNVERDVIFQGTTEHIVWKSPLSSLYVDSIIYSRKNYDTVLLINGNEIASFSDIDGSTVPTEKKRGLFKNKNLLANCEIYYINKSLVFENKWGTPDRVHFNDKKFGVQTTVGVNGSYKFNIKNSQKLISKIVGNADYLTSEDLRRKFATEVIFEIRDILTSVLNDGSFSLLDIANVASSERKLADLCHESLEKVFDNYGVKLEKLIIFGIHFDEEILSKIQKLQSSTAFENFELNSEESLLEKKQNLIKQKMKHDLELEELRLSKEKMRKELELKEALVKQERDAFYRSQDRLDVEFDSKSKERVVLAENRHKIGNSNESNEFIFCGECGVKNPRGSKFCNNCGKSVVVTTNICSICKTEVDPGSKFCNNCGNKQ